MAYGKFIRRPSDWIAPKSAAEMDAMAMMRQLVREGFALAVLPPIAVRDELESGVLVEGDSSPGIGETFFAVTVERRFPNARLREFAARRGVKDRTVLIITTHLASGDPPSTAKLPLLPMTHLK